MIRVALLAATMTATGIAPAFADLPTMPLNAVRSLHHIQDQIAGGDASAFSMQTQTLQVIDGLFANMRLGTLYEGETLAALMTYAVSGGNPATFARAYSVISEELEGDDRQVLDAVAAAVLGQPVPPEQAISPRSVGGMLGGGIALLTATRASSPKAQIRLLDEARLIAPGTLIEESALRRLVTLYAEKDEFEQMLRLASRYARTFVTSPYASDFAGTLIATGPRMTQPLVHERLAEVISFMPEAHRRSIVGRLMRASAVAGNFDLVRFLEARFAIEVEAMADARNAAPSPALEDPDVMRRRLFALMANITTTDHAEVAQQLAAIDETRLAPADRQLLDAARAIASELTRPIAREAREVAGVPAVPAPAAQPMPATPDPLLPADPLLPQAPAAPSVAQTPMDAAPSLSPELDGFISQTRSVLEAVDAMLEEANP